MEVVATMSSGSSRQDVSELFARKSITIIPKDQRALHENPKSWAAEAMGQSSDWAPVPSHVIQAARDAFSRAKRKRDLELSSTTAVRKSPRGRAPKHSSPPCDKPAVKDTQLDLPRGSSVTAPDQHFQCSIVNETPRRVPSMGPPPRPSLTESSIEHSTPDKEVGVAALDTMDSTPISAPSRLSARQAINYNFPSSGPEEDLEMQVPQAQVRQEYATQQHIAENSSAPTSSLFTESSVHNTPPCAQPSQSPILSIHLEPQPSSSKLPAPPSKQIVAKIRPLKRIFPELGRPNVPDEGPRHKVSTTTYSPANTLSSNSTTSPPPANTDHPPPMIEASNMAHTPTERREQGRLHRQAKNQSAQPYRLPVSMQRQRHPDASHALKSPQPSTSVPKALYAPQASNHELSDDESESSQASLGIRIVPATLEQVSHSHENERELEKYSQSDSINDGNSQSQQTETDSNEYELDMEKHARAQNQRRTRVHPAVDMSTHIQRNSMPYAIFTATYPSYEAEYSGSLWSFIRACVCLEYLRQTSSLRDFLWDEFIRAFSAGYYDYVNTHTNPVPAIEWFNNLEGTPEFTSMVVKKDNIGRVLSLYKESVEEAKGYIKPAGAKEGTDVRRTSTTAPSVRGTANLHPKASQMESKKGKRPSIGTPVATDLRSKRLRTNSVGKGAPSPTISGAPSSATLLSNVSTSHLHSKQTSARSSSASLVRTNSWKYGRSLRNSSQDRDRQEQLRQFIIAKTKGVERNV